MISMLDDFTMSQLVEVTAQTFKTLGNRPNERYGAITHELCHDYNADIKRKVFSKMVVSKGLRSAE